MREKSGLGDLRGCLLSFTCKAQCSSLRSGSHEVPKHLSPAVDQLNSAHFGLIIEGHVTQRPQPLSTAKIIVLRSTTMLLSAHPLVGKRLSQKRTKGSSTVIYLFAARLETDPDSGVAR